MQACRVYSHMHPLYLHITTRDFSSETEGFLYPYPFFAGCLCRRRGFFFIKRRFREHELALYTILIVSSVLLVVARRSNLLLLV